MTDIEQRRPTDKSGPEQKPGDNSRGFLAQLRGLPKVPNPQETFLRTEGHATDIKGPDAQWPINQDAMDTRQEEETGVDKEEASVDLSTTKADQQATRPIMTPVQRRTLLTGGAGAVLGGFATWFFGDKVKSTLAPKTHLVAAQPTPSPTPSPSPSVETSSAPVRPEAYFGYQVAETSTSSGEYKKNDTKYPEYSSSKLETTTKFYVLDNRVDDLKPETRARYEKAFKDKRLLRMLGRVHEVINGKSFENIIPDPTEGPESYRESINKITDPLVKMFIDAWDRSIEFSRLDELFRIFKRSYSTTQLRDNAESNAAITLNWFLKEVIAHPDTATINDSSNRITNRFTPEHQESQVWEYPTVRPEDRLKPEKS